MSYPVAEKTGIAVGGIFAPRLSLLLQKDFQVGVPEAQQRTDYLALVFAVVLEDQSRVNSSQAADARSAQHAKQNRFSLIVEGVGGGDFRDPLFSHQFAEVVVAQFAGGGFHSGVGPRQGRFAGVQFQAMVAREAGDKLFIFVGFLAPELMIDVCDRQYDPKFSSQLDEQEQQCHRVGAPGNRYRQAVASLDNRALPDCVQQSLGQFLHWEIVQ